MGSKVPPKSAICRPRAVFAPRGAALCVFKWPPGPSEFFYPSGFSRLRAGRASRSCAFLRHKVSFALRGGLASCELFQRTGHASHQLRYPFAGGRGDGVEIEFALRAMLPQPLQPRTVRGGIELG